MATQIVAPYAATSTPTVATAVKALVPGVRVVGVEPATADDARQSLAAGEIVAALD